MEEEGAARAVVDVEKKKKKKSKHTADAGETVKVSKKREREEITAAPPVAPVVAATAEVVVPPPKKKKKKNKTGEVGEAEAGEVEVKEVKAAAPVKEAEEGEQQQKKKKKKKSKHAAAEGELEGSGERKEGATEEELNEEEERARLGVSVIASPLAGKKLTRHCLKLVKQAAAVKCINRGIKEVIKAIRKGKTGLMILAGNITPIDILSHLPILCEEKAIPYVFVPSKEDLGHASLTKRPCSAIMVFTKDKAEHLELYAKVRREMVAAAAAK